MFRCDIEQLKPGLIVWLANRACRHDSRAYVAHLLRAAEILRAMLLTEHNLTYYQDLMKGLRGAIEAGRLKAFVAEFHAARATGDIAPL